MEQLTTREDGLIFRKSGVVGYIFKFDGHGAFDPSGKVEGGLTDEQIQRHNKSLADLEWSQLLESGKGILYRRDQDAKVGDWAGVHNVPVRYSSKSWHNFAGKNGRTDYWFTLDGSEWHGVLIGDSDIVRAKRSKRN